MYVEITRIDEAKNSLVLSEKEAWVSIQIYVYFLFFVAFLHRCFEYLGLVFFLFIV